MTISKKVKELENELMILEDIKKMVDNQCSGFELADMMTKLPKKVQETLESHLISIDTAKEFQYNPFCPQENDKEKINFPLFKKFEVFVWNLNKLLEDTKAELKNYK